MRGGECIVAHSSWFFCNVCLNEQHEQHVLQVADLELVKEFGRQDSYWWMKDSAEEIQGLFEKYFTLQVTEAEEGDSDGSSDD